MSRWNATRYRGHSPRGHSESYFLKLNDPRGERALWLKVTILARVGAPAVAETWAVAFERGRPPVAAKEVVPWSSASFSTERLEIRAARVSLRDGRAEGAVSTGGHELAWALDFTTDVDPLVPFPSEKMYSDRAPYWKYVSPHPDSVFRGEYSVDGAAVAVDGWRGMQGHNWGRRHTERYAWGHCNQWRDAEELVFEGASGQPRVGPVLVPTVSMFFVWHRGVRYAFNEGRGLLGNRGSFDFRRWEFSARTELASVSGELVAMPSQIAGLMYENPDGAMTYCLNSKIAEARLRLEVKGRAPLVATSNAAAFEVGTRDPSHGVAMLV